MHTLAHTRTHEVTNACTSAVLDTLTKSWLRKAMEMKVLEKTCGVSFAGKMRNYFPRSGPHNGVEQLGQNSLHFPLRLVTGTMVPAL